MALLTYQHPGSVDKGKTWQKEEQNRKEDEAGLEIKMSGGALGSQKDWKQAAVYLWVAQACSGWIEARRIA